MIAILDAFDPIAEMEMRNDKRRKRTDRYICASDG